MRINMRALFLYQGTVGEITSLRDFLSYHFVGLTIGLREAHQRLSPEMLIPGLVLGLRHNLNQERNPTTGDCITLFSASADTPVLLQMKGGDEEAPRHRGYEWWMVSDNPGANPVSWIGELPPGITLGLKHSMHQKNERITVFGLDPVLEHSSSVLQPFGLGSQIGGDLGAPSGHGYYWYETTGKGFSDRSIVAKLPRWIVLGLKHSRNQKNKKVLWKGQEYDPVDPNITPPSGFERRVGGDRNGHSGEGYYWYEKVTGPEIVVKPALKVKLKRSLIMSLADNKELDKDHDGLIDTLEGALANSFRPYVIFDSDEGARLPHEPVTLFQMRPLDLSGNIKRIGIKWVFLFRQDGGYGPTSSWANDAHDGDNDDAFYELESRDGGVTWTLIRAALSSRGENIFAGPEWPKSLRLEVYDLTHPIIYMSAGKHHEYFTRDWDEIKDSLYSDILFWEDANDDVDGRGARFLVDLRSLEKTHGYFNNVGEPESHPSPPFVDDLRPYYPYSAWGSENFYDKAAGSTRNKWMKS